MQPQIVKDPKPIQETCWWDSTPAKQSKLIVFFWLETSEILRSGLGESWDNEQQLKLHIFMLLLPKEEQCRSISLGVAL